MATRCLAYLSMPAFDIFDTQESIDKKVMQGAYSFADYAVCFWAYHLESSVSDLSLGHDELLQSITEHLEVFIDTYWTDTGKPFVVSNTLRERMQALKPSERYEQACQAVSAAKHWLRPTSKSPTSDDILSLSVVLGQIRATIERISLTVLSPEGFIKPLAQFYGQNLYKCPRLNCQYFHQGFETKEQREQHTNKHDRSFTCPERGCPFSFIGFTTARELANHNSEHHGIKPQFTEPEFPADVPPKPASARDPTPETPTLPNARATPEPVKYHLPRVRSERKKFECNMCGKIFTRAYNLRSHLRSHNDERPFVCRTCRKAFVREADMKRHEGTHDNERQIICHGVLDSGERWGCGRRFGRADALVQHYKSEVGRRCIQSQKEEEARQSQQSIFDEPPNADRPGFQAYAYEESSPTFTTRTTPPDNDQVQQSNEEAYFIDPSDRTS